MIPSAKIKVGKRIFLFTNVNFKRCTFVIGEIIGYDKGDTL